jgi:DNA-binding NarL/FixJ family response regulator
LTERTGIPIQHTDGLRFEHWLVTAQQALSEGVAVSAYAEGQRMQLEEAIAFALVPHEQLAVAANELIEPRPAQTSDRLTLRQCEVAALIAQGRSNRQIAEALVITERTVASHVEQILNRLGFVSRTQIGVWASEHGLHPPSVA